MGVLNVSPVRGWSDRRAFIELPYRIYAGDPNWVPPLRRTERRRWSPRHNPSLAGRTIVRFLARRDGRVVGRIAAIVDPEFQRWSADTGFFGFFESEDDFEAAASLFEAAESALADLVARRILGPVNLTTHDEVGFLVDGFDRPPAILDPYNPPRYPALAERLEYSPVREYHAFLWRPSVEPAPAIRRLLKRLEYQGTARGVGIRSVRPDRWDDEVRLLRGLYNRCFADLWGFIPIAHAEMAARAAEFRAFYRPEIILIAEARDQPVGFVLTLPDVNRALVKARGRLLPLGWLRIARAITTTRHTRLLLLGVVPEFRGRGVAALLAGAVHQAGRRLGISGCELSLVQGSNDPMRHVIEAFDAPRIKTFRLYGKEIGGG